MNPITGRITSKFGYRKHPVTGKRSFHNGVDIAVPVGTPIHAPLSGKIQDVWTDDEGGLSVSMITSSGFRFGFAHLQQSLVKQSQFVQEGDVIALSGNSGHTTGPHLHFTVRLNDIFQDPLENFDFKK